MQPSLRDAASVAEADAFAAGRTNAGRIRTAHTFGAECEHELDDGKLRTARLFHTVPNGHERQKDAMGGAGGLRRAAFGLYTTFLGCRRVQRNP
jgi:hypothetical protein